MPAHKRPSSSENFLHEEDFLQQHYRRKQSRRERIAEEEGELEREREGEEVKEEEEDDDPEAEDSDGSRSSDDPAKLSEWLQVELPALRTYVQCPICLGIIKKTRTVMECLHRFCRDCIDKSMRLGNNECPACRTHCASRRSLRDDPRFDAMIESLFDIEKYEEEELAFHEEEKIRNKQIQASIAQIFRRQSEVLVKRRKSGKDTASASATRLVRNYRNSIYSRRRRNTRGAEPEGSEDNYDEAENNHDGNEDSSSADERGAEIKQRRYKRRARAQRSQPSPSAASSDCGGVEDDLEASRESKGASSGPMRNTEMLAWGGGAARSKSFRNTRVMKLTKYLENSMENDDKLDVHLMLISVDKQSTPSLKHLYFCCPPHFSVDSIKEYVAHKTQLRAEDLEVLLVKKYWITNVLQPSFDPSTSMVDKLVLQILEGEAPLAGLRANYASYSNPLILAYRLKERLRSLS